MASGWRKSISGLLFWCVLAGPAAAQVTVPVGGTMSIPPGGSVNLGCSGLDVQGTVQINSGQLDQVGGLAIAATGTVDGGTGVLGVSGDWSNAGAFVAGSGTVVLGTDCTAGPIQISGNTVFHNLTLTSTTGGTFVIPAGSHLTVNGTLTLLGAPGTPIQLVSSSGLTAYVTLGPGAALVTSNATVSPNVRIGSTAALAQGIPTLGEFGVVLLSLLLAAGAAAGRQRLPSSLRRRAPSQGDSPDAR